MTPWTIHTLEALLRDLQSQALHAGRYPDGATWANRKSFHGRAIPGQLGGGTVPFRCISYERTVRQITALARALRELGA